MMRQTSVTSRKRTDSLDIKFRIRLYLNRSKNEENRWTKTDLNEKFFKLYLRLALTPEFFSPLFELLNSVWRVIAERLLDSLAYCLVVLDDLHLWVLEVSYSQAGAVLRVSLPLTPSLLVTATSCSRSIRLSSVVCGSATIWCRLTCSIPIIVCLGWAVTRRFIISIVPLLHWLLLLATTHFLSFNANKTVNYSYKIRYKNPRRQLTALSIFENFCY